MQQNFKKSALPNIKGDLKAAPMNLTLASVNSQLHLGLMVSSQLTCNESCTRRTTKGIGALIQNQIKQSFTKQCSSTTKLNAMRYMWYQ